MKNNPGLTVSLFSLSIDIAIEKNCKGIYLNLEILKENMMIFHESSRKFHKENDTVDSQV